MATFHFELVSPEQLLFSGEVDQVDVPGAEGDFGVLADHAPLVATLRPGVLTIFENGQALRVVVFGGFAEVSPTGMNVLADAAVRVEDFDAALLADEIRTAEERLEDTEENVARDRIARRLEQLRGVQAAIATSAAGTAH
jgi:F-type H+-transporting ATPase subunit epsilon